MNLYAVKINSKKRVYTNLYKVASPDDILNRSHGEITKPETINYRSFRPEKDGLFCEKILVLIRDWECACGKYKRIRYKGIVCDRCGVEVTQKSVEEKAWDILCLQYLLYSMVSRLFRVKLGLSSVCLPKI